jgi:hypothetical protein
MGEEQPAGWKRWNERKKSQYISKLVGQQKRAACSEMTLVIVVVVLK